MHSTNISIAPAMCKANLYPREPMIETDALKKKKKNRCFHIPRCLLFQTTGNTHYRWKTIHCTCFVSLTELKSSFLKTRWVLPTLTQNHAAHRKEIKYTWLPGMKALVKISSVRYFAGPFSHLEAFTPKECPLKL